MIEQEFNLGKWLSAAMEDDSVCTEMKSDIEDWFNYIEQRENIVEQQAAKLAALRGFVSSVRNMALLDNINQNQVIDAMKAWDLIDENG